MAGLLDNDYTPDPLAMGLLGMGSALMTPRAMGGGVGAGMNAFAQQAMAAQQMRRQMQADAERQQLMRERTDMDRQRFGFERDQYTAQQSERARVQQVMGQVREQLARDKPEMLPLFDVNPQEAMKRLFPQPGEAKVVTPGGALVQDGRVVYQSPDKPAAPTDLGRMIAEMQALPPGDPRRPVYEQAIRKSTTHAPAASMNVSYGAPFEGIGPDGKPMLYQPNNRGGPPQATGLAAPPKAGAKPTEDENRSAGLAVRMEDALRTMTAVTSRNPGAATPPLVQSILGKVSETAANSITPEARQRVEAAQLDALDAALTLATGAAYTKEQLASLSRSYFPQIGDKPETIREKQARLQKVIETARIRAGTAGGNIDRVLGNGPAAGMPQTGGGDPLGIRGR